MNGAVPRDLHPLAWWAWAVGVAVAASTTTNPLVLALLFGAVWAVVSARRGTSPWARSFRLYVLLGVAIVVLRVLFYVLVGIKYDGVPGVRTLIALPQVPLPDWAAGVTLLGPVQLEGLLATVALALRLAMLVVAIGAANALANPKRLLRSMPRALHELGTAVVVSVSVAPQLAESVQRVLRARQLRGDSARGLRVLPRVALPVLQDTLDRSLLLASAMESRGYGSRGTERRARWLPAVTLGGLVVVGLGLYDVLDPTVPGLATGYPVLAAGVGLVALGIVLSGRSVRVTTYRPDPWRTAETLALLSGLGCAGAMLAARQTVPVAMDLQSLPLVAPTLPVLALLGALLAALPSFVTPPPAAVATRAGSRSGRAGAAGRRGRSHR